MADITTLSLVNKPTKQKLKEIINRVIHDYSIVEQFFFNNPYFKSTKKKLIKRIYQEEGFVIEKSVIEEVIKDLQHSGKLAVYKSKKGALYIYNRQE